MASSQSDVDQEVEDIVQLALNISLSAGQVRISACTAQRTPVPIAADSATHLPDHYVLSVLEFIDDNQLSVLDSYLTQIGNAEVHISDDQLAAVTKALGKKLTNLLEARRLSLRAMKKIMFQKKADTLPLLSSLARGSAHIVHKVDCELTLSHGCCECLINLLNLRDSSCASNHYEIVIGSLDRFMRLDSAAAEAVSLLPSPSCSATYSSIYGLLNHCKTKSGSKLLQRWLCMPLLDAAAISARQDMVQLFVAHPLHRDQLRDGPFRTIPDVDKVINKMRQGKAGLEEVFRLYLFVRSLPPALDALTSLATATSEVTDESSLVDTLNASYLTPLGGIIKKFGLFEQLVEQVLDLAALPEFRVNPSFSAELTDLSKLICQLEADADKVETHVARQFPEMRLERSSQHGFVLRSPKVEQEVNYKQSRELIILSILKNGVYVTTKPLQAIADAHSSLQEEYSNLSAEIVSKAVDTACSYLNIMESISLLIAELDVLAAWANVAACSTKGYVRPRLLAMGSGVIDLVDARHPCVELTDHVADFIPNDYSMSRGSSHFQIITGPNMVSCIYSALAQYLTYHIQGGKSTYIRAIGCIVLLAQIGCYVPCSEATVSIVDGILARVGAGDAQQKGVSTFMAEMLESAVILQRATPNSLLIIDELGRGTSTFDGYGLAYAISHHLANKVQCFTLFATHFHEVTTLQDDCDGVVNQHVEAYLERGELTMLYKLRAGVAWQSYGVPVARSAHFPVSVLQQAERKLQQLERSIAHHAAEEDGEPLVKKQRRAIEQQEAALDTLDISSYCTPPEEVKQKLRRWMDLVPTVQV